MKKLDSDNLQITNYQENYEGLDFIRENISNLSV